MGATRIANVLTISKSDAAYPAPLQHIHRPPKQLYVSGDSQLLQHPYILAVVGSRRASHNGKQAAEKLLTLAVQNGAVVVSGMAFGIDAIAHRICLAQKQPTIAVLGSGIDEQSIYPRTHVQLAQDIITAGGAVISEYPPGTPAFVGHFPMRNRIIAGLARATLVIQAARRSGSLITARLALESGRDVLSVPGAITDPLAVGTNKLIQQGAIPALAAEDILDALELNKVAKDRTKILPELSNDQQQIIDTLSTTPQHIDDIATRTSLPTPQLSVLLIELEMLEIVRNVGGMKYTKSETYK